MLEETRRADDAMPADEIRESNAARTGAKCREVLQAAIWEKYLWVELLSGCHKMVTRCGFAALRLTPAVAAACACAWRCEFRRGVFSYPSPACGGGRPRAQASAGGGACRVTPPRPPSLSLRRATLPFQGRDKKARKRHRPYSLRRGVRRRPSPPSAGTCFFPLERRGDGAPSGAPVFPSCRVPVAKNAGASRRSMAASIRRRAALSDVPFRPASGSELRPLLGGRFFRASGKPRGPPSASSSQGVVVPPGGAPAPPGRGRSVRLPRAGAASPPARTTPHESALTRRRRVEYNPS